ncbi:Transcriptional adapter ADA2b [Galdieria sulphuraria]|nr:Transcriptional adapter ADA2b [Galdieria sulphuraria]
MDSSKKSTNPKLSESGTKDNRGNSQDGHRNKRARTKSSSRPSSQGSIVYYCNYCKRDVSRVLHIRCAECQDFDLCVDCFWNGLTLWPHREDSPYRVISPIYSPLYCEDWTALEEEFLLDGLERFGLDNWTEVAQHIQTRHPLETRAHYVRTYFNSEYSPLPDPNTVLSRDNTDYSIFVTDPDPKSLRVMHHYTEDDNAGWMPKRGDFVYEWSNEAEEILADMEISPNDNNTEKEIKLRLLEIYNAKLDEREMRKDFLLKRELLDTKRREALMNSLSSYERELYEKLCVFARFMPQEDFLELIRSSSEEKELRSQISDLLPVRLAGAKTMEEYNEIEPKHLSTLDLNQSEKGNFGEDISRPEEMDGAELLSTTELTLCKNLKICPQQLLIFKEHLIRESAKAGFLRRKDVKDLIKYDTVKVLRVYDYLIACGWVNPEPPSDTTAPQVAVNVHAGNGSSK